MARVTLQTIAERVGVSRMTVSNAFSRPNQLSAELRQRILAAADELGYVGPDPAARALARGTAGAVGVLLTDSLADAFSDEVATTFLGAIAGELSPSGLALTLLSSSTRGDVIPARDVPMDGALVYSCDTESTGTAWLLRRKLPVVFVDQDPAPGIPSVNIDDRGGALAAAQHIVALGHRRVGIVYRGVRGPLGVVDDPLARRQSHATRQRLLGWNDALAAAGIRPTAVQVPHTDRAAGFDGAMIVLPSAQPPTAVLCFSDAIAAGVIQAAERLGLSVPDHLSIVGYDDSPLAEHSRPPLTTVRQDVAAKGRAAASALTAAIERSRHDGNRTPRARHLVLPTELVIRESTAPPLG